VKPPKTLITTPFGAESTAAEVVAGVDLTGKRAIVTGGSSGIGIGRRRCRRLRGRSRKRRAALAAVRGAA
jgi:hypothetical protein